MTKELQMNNQLKVGSKVRFLNAIGGGYVKKIERGLAYVEDEDGFAIPTPVNECVVVCEEDTFVPAYKPPTIKRKKHEPEPGQPQLTKADFGAPETPAPKPMPVPSLPHTYLPGSNKINLYLAFVSTDTKRLGQCEYLAYLVNDSNYVLSCTYLNQTDGARWHTRHAETIEPNMKVLIEQFTATEINDLEHLAVQCIAYQTDRNFALKAPCCVQLHLDTVKFFKLHSFEENDFFDEPAWVIPLVENDEPQGQTRVDPKRLEQALLSKKEADRPQPAPKPQKDKRNEPLEIDLHAHALLDNLQGLQPKDILEYQLQKFKEVMDEQRANRGRSIIFIHGKGEGVLRSRLEKMLRKQYPSCQYQDASFQEYGFGATRVIIG